ncbi:hypothetical protein KPL70_026712 [Citrus sinensis]|uniref:Uncharacterized protein n=1 Tax=Citrus sinensis TaxID=2711 RepID=A0ACB8NYV4_CITSI|nr:hypothetical protein KPL70_026712 [Citrus sinensis]KAH9803324.1 hypothetical protein KPL71_001720 [Citrus sinensis]
MVVVESASQDSVVSSAGSISASNGQDHPKQNGGTMVMSLDQGLYNQNNQRSNGGGDFKRDMRELQELYSKLNPMAEEFVPPSLAKTNNNNLVVILKTMSIPPRAGGNLEIMSRPPQPGGNLEITSRPPRLGGKLETMSSHLDQGVLADSQLEDYLLMNILLIVGGSSWKSTSSFPPNKFNADAGI